MPTLLALLLLTATACSTSTEPTTNDDLVEEDVVVGRPLGTFRPADMANRGQFEFLTLRSDKTYHAAEYVTTPTVTLPGRYVFARNSHGRYLVLIPYDNDGHDDMSARVSWRYEPQADGSLKFFYSPYSDASFVVKQTPEKAWCSEASQCSKQGLPQPRCPGQWTCEQNSCAYSTCGVP